MKRKISRYTLLLAISFTALLPATQAQTPVKGQEEHVPFYQGASISVDVFGIGSKLLGGDFLSSEISLDVNLKNKFFPVLELGYGTTDATEDTYNMHYKGSAPFGRIGLNYNMMSKKKSNNFLYLGLRYGIAPRLKYDVQGPALQDEVWGSEVPFAFSGEKSSAHWGELLVGIKVDIYKNFLMGWTFRYKAKISVKDNPNTTPWYIPGYGKNTSSLFGVTYNLIYILPF